MSKPVVKLHAAAMNRMQRSMREALPRETGGILLGWRDHGDIVVVDALPVMDTEADVTHYMRSQDIAKSALDGICQPV